MTLLLCPVQVQAKANTQGQQESIFAVALHAAVSHPPLFLTHPTDRPSVFPSFSHHMSMSLTPPPEVCVPITLPVNHRGAVVGVPLGFLCGCELDKASESQELENKHKSRIVLFQNWAENRQHSNWSQRRTEGCQSGDKRDESSFYSRAKREEEQWRAGGRRIC